MSSRLLKIASQIFVMFMCLIVTSCYFNSEYLNREKDMQAGKKVVTQFYELLKNKNYKETYKLFDKRFFKVTDTQKLNEIYELSLNKLGDIENYDIEKWETRNVVGTHPKTEYLFIFNVRRSGFLSKETIVLVKEEDDIKIISYHVDSEVFFKDMLE